MPKSSKKELNREGLLNQGVVFFMNQGYHGTGLQEILDAVNVPKGSFYNYFSSKEEFGAAVIQHYIEPFISRLSTHLQQSGSDALGAIRRYFDELIVELEENKFKGGCLLGSPHGRNWQHQRRMSAIIAIGNRTISRFIAIRPGPGTATRIGQNGQNSRRNG